MMLPRSWADQLPTPITVVMPGGGAELPASRLMARFLPTYSWRSLRNGFPSRCHARPSPSLGTIFT